MEDQMAAAVWISAIADFATAVVAGIALYAAFRELGHLKDSVRQAGESIQQTEHSLQLAERSLRYDAYTGTIDRLEKHREARHILYDDVPKQPSAAGIIALDAKKLRKLDAMLREFDALGLLVKHGVVPLGFVMDFYSRPLVVAWHRLEPHITEERRKRGQPGHMKKLEMLALFAKKHRDAEHPDEETFFVSPESEQTFAAQERLWVR
jgi:hypothetical protein